MSHPTRRAPRGDDDPFLRNRESDDSYDFDFEEDEDEDEDDEDEDEDEDEDDDFGLVAWETGDEEEWDN